ncbi:hypothetical protein EU528_10200 [Candidatus Thorarchaeota archaeon]|nr:MAG: hypothetical protein EU528_10200 [Candidatus Thorarchaeota archaeon]
MTIGGQSTRRVLGCAIAIVLAGVIIIGFTVTMNPPTSDFPEPSFSYMTMNDIFKYSNRTSGGASSNYLEFHISFDNLQDGSAYLRFSSATVTVWVADITTHQPNTSLMRVDQDVTELGCNPSRIQDQLHITYDNSTDGEWFSTGMCEVILGTSELFPNNIIIVDYVFMVSNGLAMEFDGHQFLVKIQAEINYSAFYLGGLIGLHYQTSSYEYVLGEQIPIYMMPYET